MICEIIPSHTVASWLLQTIYKGMDAIGLRHDKVTEEFIYVAVIVVLALAIGWLLKFLILWMMRKIIAVKRPALASRLTEYHVLTRWSAVIPPLVILALLPFAFAKESALLGIAEKIIVVYTIIVLTLAINSIITLAWMQYNDKRNTKNLPIKGILNSIVGIIWIISGIVAVSILLDKSPMMLLTGLGAFAAALMLVFKDSILGFVSGIQLSQNDMLRVGDWIVVPSTIANGIVIDVSLTAVKVQNWDNTIVTLPPYTLVSTSFQNWRGMSDSGCRQIARSLLIDTDSIQPINAARVDELVEKYPLLKPWVEKSRKAGRVVNDPGKATINGSLDTNLGLLRAYLCAYILESPDFTNDAQVLVRLLTPQPEGVPLQLYCFTSTTAWTAYEAIQSSLFEHAIVVAGDFGLQIYNAESGLEASAPVDVNLHTVEPSPAPATPAPAATDTSSSTKSSTTKS